MRMILSCAMLLGLSLCWARRRPFSKATPPLGSRRAVIAPEYIYRIRMSPRYRLTPEIRRLDFFRIMNKAHYGRRTSPTLWWLAISQNPRQRGIRRRRLDISMHTWRPDGLASGANIDIMLIFRADYYFLLGRDECGLRFFINMMASFKTGSICALPRTEPPPPT